MAITTTAALLGAATLGAGALSASSSNKAAKRAADASTTATRESNALQEKLYNQTRADLSPFVQSGVTAQNALQQRYGLASANTNTAPNAMQQPGVVGAQPANDGEFAYDPNNPGATVSNPQPQQAPAAQPVAYGAPAAGAEPGQYGNVTDPTYNAPAPFSFTGADYQESPGFKFQMERGIDAINSSQAARGSLYSGATGKAILQFAQGLANQDFTNAENRARSYYDTDANRARSNFDADRGYLTNQFNQNTNVLQNMATSGQNAAAQVGTAGQNYATNTGNALQQNASNVGNAGLVAAQNNSNLIGQGVNALSYYARPGVVNSLASGGIVPKANSATNQFSGYAFG